MNAGLQGALKMKLMSSELHKVEFRRPTAARVSCTEGKEARKIACCQSSQGGKVGRSKGRDCANSRCQLRAALGLASALDVIS